MLHIKHIPVADKAVKHTFNIQRFHVREIPGWRIVRMHGRFWQFPPIADEHVPRDFIERCLNNARDLSPMEHTMAVGKSNATRSSQGAGAYWTGQHGFMRQQHPNAHVNTELVVAILPKGVFKGIKISCVYDGKPFTYVLVTDKDVDVRTFYKYLYFYPKYISHHSFGERGWQTDRLPYALDKRLFDSKEEAYAVVETF